MNQRRDGFALCLPVQENGCVMGSLVHESMNGKVLRHLPASKASERGEAPSGSASGGGDVSPYQTVLSPKSFGFSLSSQVSRLSPAFCFKTSSVV
jgi:hypothetical protein